MMQRVSPILFSGCHGVNTKPEKYRHADGEVPHDGCGGAPGVFVNGFGQYGRQMLGADEKAAVSVNDGIVATTDLH
jgi:hypothetical protein